MTQQTILIDADIVAYTTGWAVQESIDWSGDGDYSDSASLPKAREAIRKHIGDITEACGGGRVVLCLSDTANFRRDVYPDYKGNRRQPEKAPKKPMLLKPILAFMREEWETVTRPTLEADDCLGILATCETQYGKPEDIIIASTDKDMMTIPGRHYNWGKPELGIRRVSEWAADLAFFTQTLTGDSSDGYPGCPGVGPKGAAKAFDTYNEGGAATLWQIVVELYEKKHLTELHAIQQARLARILRVCDYDFEKKEVILWLPPKG